MVSLRETIKTLQDENLKLKTTIEEIASENIYYRQWSERLCYQVISSARSLAQSPTPKRTGVLLMPEHEKITLTLSQNLSADNQYATKSTFKARFVRAGRVKAADGTNSNIHRRTVSPRNRLHKFQNCAVFIDHAGFFDYPSLSRLAGVTANPQYNPTEQSIEGEIKLNSTPAGSLASDLIHDLLGNPEASPDIGLSMVFYARFAPRDDPDETTKNHRNKESRNQLTWFFSRQRTEESYRHYQQLEKMHGTIKEKKLCQTHLNRPH